MDDAHARVRGVAESTARTSYGRLVAWLATQWRDVQAAEDALSDAFVAALDRWPLDGVPASPEAWLLTAAKRRLLEAHRHARVTRDHARSEMASQDEAVDAPDPQALPDRRLHLMLACSHPAIDSALHTPLMLQTVLGLEVKDFAPAFLISPAAMAQRLVRAKAKLRDAGIPFELPDADVLGERIHAVLEALYAGYGYVHDAGPGADADPILRELRSEMLYLAELVVALAPGDAEAMGLLALMWFCEARREETPGAEFVPLHERDASRWNRTLLIEADRLLWRASALRAPGPFQLEAAIQSAHSQRAYTGLVPWDGIVALYEQLLRIAPTLGARIGHAVALAKSRRVPEALARLDDIDPRTCVTYQPYWVALAHVSSLSGDTRRAAVALQRAVALTESEPLRRFLLRAQGR